MPNIILAQQMLDTLKHDFAEAAKSPSRMVGHVNLKAYCQKFGVIQEDIDAYCATLIPLTPTYPVCVFCGEKWTCLDNNIKPIGNGHIIDFVDSFEMWCCPTDESHDTIWYYQTKDVTCSFDMEVENLHGECYQVRWNCRCMDPACYEKNVIYQLTDRDEEWKLIGFFTDQELPFNSSRETLYQLIKAKHG